MLNVRIFNDTCEEDGTFTIEKYNGKSTSKCIYIPIGKNLKWIPVISEEQRYRIHLKLDRTSLGFREAKCKLHYVSWPEKFMKEYKLDWCFYNDSWEGKESENGAASNKAIYVYTAYQPAVTYQEHVFKEDNEIPEFYLGDQFGVEY